MPISWDDGRLTHSEEFLAEPTLGLKMKKGKWNIVLDHKKWFDLFHLKKNIESPFHPR